MSAQGTPIYDKEAHLASWKESILQSVRRCVHGEYGIMQRVWCGEAPGRSVLIDAWFFHATNETAARGKPSGRRLNPKLMLDESATCNMCSDSDYPSFARWSIFPSYRERIGCSLRFSPVELNTTTLWGPLRGACH